MITPNNFCLQILSILENIKISYDNLFTNIISMFYLNNEGILRIDYCPYYTAKIKKRFAIINRSNSDLGKLIKLDSLCKKIYNYSLFIVGELLVIDNFPFQRQDGSIIDIDDFKITFNVIDKIIFLKQISPKKYILKFRDINNNINIQKLLNNKIIEGNLIQTKLVK